MDPLHARPRFEIEVDAPVEAVREGLLRAITDDEGVRKVQVAPRHLELTVSGPEHHAWSPWLSLELSQREARTRIRGRFGPAPALWTMFAFFYGASMFMAFFGATAAVIQWSIDEEPTGQYLSIFGLVCMASACGTHLLGLRVGRPQIRVLHAFIRRTLDGIIAGGARPVDDAAPPPAVSG